MRDGIIWPIFVYLGHFAQTHQTGKLTNTQLARTTRAGDDLTSTQQDASFAADAEVRVRAGTVGLAGVGHLVGTQNVDGV